MPDVKLSFEAIGTHWVIDLFQLPSDESSNAILSAVTQRIDRYDKVYSRFKDTTVVAEMSRTAGKYELPEDAEELIQLYQDLYQKTQGKFTPMIGQNMVEAGYDANYSLEPSELHPVANFLEIVSFESPFLTLTQPALLDFGAAGKGHLIDLVGDVLRQHGCSEFCIDAGGDILHSTSAGKSLTIGLENPENLSQVIGIATISDQSICGSAGNRRKWKNFHHIIDPITLESPQHILSTWVIAEDALLADALATCLFFTSAKELKKDYTFEHTILYADHTVDVSTNFPAEFFTS